MNNNISPTSDASDLDMSTTRLSTASESEGDELAQVGFLASFYPYLFLFRIFDTLYIHL